MSIFLPCCLTLLVILGMVGVVSSEFNYTITPSPFVSVQQGDVADLRMNLTGLTTSIMIEVTSSDPAKFTVELPNIQVSPIYDTVVYQNGSTGLVLRTDGVRAVTIPIQGISFGIERIEFVVRDDSGLIDPNRQIQSYVVKIKRIPSALSNVFTYILLVWLMMSYITMGVKLDMKVIKGKLRRPIGVVIGALCQFIVMPGVAALLARALNLTPTAAVALIITGSCPGGWLSNIFTLLLDCDLVLSLTMTFCSTMIALGLMPLNLFIYATPYASDDGSNVRIPFLQIFIQLITLVVPLLVGAAIAHRFPRAAKWFQRIMKPLAILIITVAFVSTFWANYFVFESPADIYLSAIILPVTAGVLGLFIAKLTCLSNISAFTVGVETGCQNSLLAISVIGLSFPQPEADLMISVPVLLALFTFMQGFIFTSIYVVMKRFPGRFELPESKSDEDGAQAYQTETQPTDLQHNDVNLSSRIQGFGPKELERAASKRSKNQKKIPPSWTSTKATQVDIDEIVRSSTRVSHINRAFQYDSDRSRTHTPISNLSISRVTLNDEETKNSQARHVYL